MSVASWCSACACAFLCVGFCTGHFVMVPLNLNCLHCLQHSFFEHHSINIIQNNSFQFLIHTSHPRIWFMHIKSTCNAFCVNPIDSDLIYVLDNWIYILVQNTVGYKLASQLLVGLFNININVIFVNSFLMKCCSKLWWKTFFASQELQLCYTTVLCVVI